MQRQMLESNEADNRSRNVKTNIIWSFILKALSVGLSFLILPLTVHYLTSVEYGVWVTLFSVMNWVNMLDMGIGLGLRNRLAEAVACNDINLVKRYISAGFFSLFGIGVCLLIFFVIGVNFIDCQTVFNTKEIPKDDLFLATLFTGVFVIIAFILSVINQIYYAYQQAAKTGWINIAHNLLMLLLVYCLTLQTEHSLLKVVFCFGIALLVSRMIFLVDFFRNNREVMPDISLVKKKYIKNIMNIGMQFFIIQLSVICMFNSANILITQRLGPEHVMAYDIVFKIFNVVTIIHGIICSPLWNAYTEAYVRHDFSWLRQVMRKMLLLMLPIGIMSFILVIETDWIIRFWIRKDVFIPAYLPMVTGVFAFVSCLNNIFAIFLNGVGKIRLQMYLGIISAIIVIPLSWYFMGVMDATGMILAIVICMLMATIPLGIQVKNILICKKANLF